MKIPVIAAIIFLTCRHTKAQTDCPVPRPEAKYAGHLQRGHLLEHSNPPYPGRAKFHDISGTVVFRAHILEDGTVGHLTHFRARPSYKNLLKRHFTNRRYSPWTVNGQPVDAFTSIPVNFSVNPSLGSSQKPVVEKITPFALQGLLIRSYPAKRSKEAEKANIFGTVQLHITLDETGHIADLGVVCGSEALDDAALETVRHWKYQPYLSNGQTVPVESTVDVKF